MIFDIWRNKSKRRMEFVWLLLGFEVRAWNFSPNYGAAAPSRPASPRYLGFTTIPDRVAPEIPQCDTG